jgi:hypothetical protein
MEQAHLCAKRWAVILYKLVCSDKNVDQLHYNNLGPMVCHDILIFVA